VNCLDAETLAAWFDGSLSGAALEDVRSHVAGCARCQALVGAMGRTRAAVPAPEPERSPRWWLAWAVPAAAAATAMAIWIAVPHPTNVAVSPSSSVSLQKQEAQPPSTPPAVPPARTEPAAPRETRATPRLQDRARAADAAAPAAAPAAANEAAQQAPRALQETITIQSAPAAPAAAAAEKRDEAGRQGAASGQLQARVAFAANPCGPAWSAPPADIAGQITAGSAPSADVCWIVGRAGSVLRSTDRQTWQRMTFPQAVDLSGVTATDARTATVVAADGRTFSTADGGVTWTER
jgi:Putative zinc-finger